MPGEMCSGRYRGKGLMFFGGYRHPENQYSKLEFGKAPRWTEVAGKGKGGEVIGK